jgi:exo beta-1,2-glucooligosaccharide sophorohydrolase (non-reducing end)
MAGLCRSRSGLNSRPPPLVAALLCFVAGPICADTAYYQRTLFDNSLTRDAYFYSSGKPSAPSSLTLVDGKLPVESHNFFTPPNALRLTWISRPGGGWVAAIRVYAWRNRVLFFPGDTLAFHCFAPKDIRASELPSIVLSDADKNFSHPLPLSDFSNGVPASRWLEIRIPLSRFTSASIAPFDPHRTLIVGFAQNTADGREHTLLLDEIRIENPPAASSAKSLHPPLNLQAKACERHVDLSWTAPPGKTPPERFIIYRAFPGQPFQPIGTQVPGVNRFADFLGNANQTATYKVKSSDAAYRESAFSSPVSASTHAMDDESLLTMVQEASFRYYWEAGSHPDSGMIRENVPGSDEIVATGATGFGILALLAGIERQFITREQGLARLLEISGFLERADRFHGAWPHFMNGHTGRRLPVFDMFDNGADLVETSFLMQGLLTARQYFHRAEPRERELDRRITALWQQVEWDWFRRTPQGAALYWHWSPEFTWFINHQLYGWNEVMITYLLAIASPTHPVPASLYFTGWAGDPPEFVNGKTFYGITLDLGQGTGGPLFFTHYSYLGFDPRGLRDRFTDYFENNRNMARINHAYCIQNPGHHSGYGDADWGITAVDGPKGYVPYEPNPKLDDGTIAPTGAIASFPYTPDASLKALKYFYRQLGDRLWSVYGFRDAFNLDQDWFSAINMGLNQAPMVVMIENYRTRLLWKYFMANPEIAPMLARVGLRPDSAAATGAKRARD